MVNEDKNSEREREGEGEDAPSIGLLNSENDFIVEERKIEIGDSVLI